MIIGEYTKQPRERESYTIFYDRDLTDGDRIVSATAMVEPAGELTVESIVPLNPRVRFWVSGGLHGTKYKVTITTLTADDRILEDEVTFRVKDY